MQEDIICAEYEVEKEEKKWEFSRRLSKGSAMTVIKCPTLLSQRLSLKK
jgi:hypothetical protein